MAVLVFKAADVRRVVEHSLAAPEQRQYMADIRKGEPVYAKPPAPAVLLVHDQGVYLMSNGTPRDLIKPDNDEPTLQDRSFVAYAKGCDPNKGTFDEWYETSRDLVGGDDFVECLPWAQQIKAWLDRGAKEITIAFTGSQIRLLG